MVQFDPVQVGVTKIFSKTADGKKRKFRHVYYAEVEADYGGWVDPTKFLPNNFDLVWIIFDMDKKPATGWYDGQQWSGRKIPMGSTCIRWKKAKEIYEE